jgi:hypothetical protein
MRSLAVAGLQQGVVVLSGAGKALSKSAEQFNPGGSRLFSQTVAIAIPRARAGR